VVHIDLEYYKNVAKVATTPEILRDELLDLINEIETDPTYKAVIGVITGKDYD
jgi:hypothetical protein